MKKLILAGLVLLSATAAEAGYRSYYVSEPASRSYYVSGYRAVENGSCSYERQCCPKRECKPRCCKRRMRRCCKPRCCRRACNECVVSYKVVESCC